MEQTDSLASRAGLSARPTLHQSDSSLCSARHSAWRLVGSTGWAPGLNTAPIWPPSPNISRRRRTQQVRGPPSHPLPARRRWWPVRRRSPAHTSPAPPASCRPASHSMPAYRPPWHTIAAAEAASGPYSPPSVRRQAIKVRPARLGSGDTPFIAALFAQVQWASVGPGRPGLVPCLPSAWLWRPSHAPCPDSPPAAGLQPAAAQR